MIMGLTDSWLRADRFLRSRVRGKHRGRTLGAFGGPQRRKDRIRAFSRARREHLQGREW